MLHQHTDFNRSSSSIRLTCGHAAIPKPHASVSVPHTAYTHASYGIRMLMATALAGHATIRAPHARISLAYLMRHTRIPHTAYRIPHTHLADGDGSRRLTTVQKYSRRNAAAQAAEAHPNAVCGAGSSTLAPAPAADPASHAPPAHATAGIAASASFIGFF